MNDEKYKPPWKAGRMSDQSKEILLHSVCSGLKERSWRKDVHVYLEVLGLDQCNAPELFKTWLIFFLGAQTPS